MQEWDLATAEGAALSKEGRLLGRRNSSREERVVL